MRIRRVERPQIGPDEGEFEPTVWFKITEAKAVAVPLTGVEQM